MNGPQKGILLVGCVFLLANLVMTVYIAAQAGFSESDPTRPSIIDDYAAWSSLVIIAGTGVLFGLSFLFKDFADKVFRFFAYGESW